MTFRTIHAQFHLGCTGDHGTPPYGSPSMHTKNRSFQRTLLIIYVTDCVRFVDFQEISAWTMPRRRFIKNKARGRL